MPDLYRVRVVPEAVADIDRIVAAITVDSLRNAGLVLDRLRAAAQSLEMFPHRYKVHRSTRDPARVVHAMPVPPWVVYYRVVESGQSVEVLTVRHGRRRRPRTVG